MRGLNTTMAGYAIIHRDNELRLVVINCQRHNFRGQAIAIFKAVWHQIINTGTHLTQCQHHQCRTGRPISIKIANNQNPDLLVNSLIQQINRTRQPFKLLRRNQPIQFKTQLLC